MMRWFGLWLFILVYCGLAALAWWWVVVTGVAAVIGLGLVV